MGFCKECDDFYFFGHKDKYCSKACHRERKRRKKRKREKEQLRIERERFAANKLIEDKRANLESIAREADEAKSILDRKEKEKKLEIEQKNNKEDTKKSLHDKELKDLANIKREELFVSLIGSFEMKLDENLVDYKKNEVNKIKSEKIQKFKNSCCKNDKKIPDDFFVKCVESFII